MKYTECKPVTAAQFRAGKPLNELLAISKEVNYYATVTEVPDWQVALIRMFDSDTDQYSYLVVENGSWLALRGPGWELLAVDDEAFRDAYREAGGA